MPTRQPTAVVVGQDGRFRRISRQLPTSIQLNRLSEAALICSQNRLTAIASNLSQQVLVRWPGGKAQLLTVADRHPEPIAAGSARDLDEQLIPPGL